MALLDKALGAMKRGLSPEKVALGLALGAALGLFPVLGTTTVLCVAAGTAMGLNHGILQTANYAVSLLYFPAFYGLMRLGEAVVGAQPLPLSPSVLAARLGSDPASLLAGLGAAGVNALVGWIVAAPVFAVAVYAVGVRVLRAAAGSPRRARLAPGLVRSSARRPAGLGGIGATLLIALIGGRAVAADLIGDAYDEKGRFVYQERHRYTFENGRKVLAETTYLGADNQPIARMEARYGNDPGAPDYRLEDLRFGWELVAAREGDGVRMTRRDHEGEQSKTVKIKPGRDLVIGPGFNDFIAARWDRLMAGETLRCVFAAPNRLRLIGFRIDKMDGASSPGAARFRIRIDNRLLRLFVPSLEVEYDVTTKRLWSYRGFSNVTDDEDEGQKVQIVFQPPGAEGEQAGPVRTADASLASEVR